MNPPKKEASLVLRAGVIAGVVFSIALVGASFLLPIVYPKVSGDVLSLAFWGLIIMAAFSLRKYSIASWEPVFFPPVVIQSSSFLVTLSAAMHWDCPSLGSAGLLPG
jgi:hypothetical protein